MKRKIFSILFALVLLCSLGLVTAAPVGASPGSYSTNLGFVGSVSFTAPQITITETPPGWSSLAVGISYAEGKATFVITAPVAFNPEAPNDNFWLVFDADNDGAEDFQVGYNTQEPGTGIGGWPEHPTEHWFYKTGGSWYQLIPGDWAVSETGLSEFTVSIPVSYLGGANSNYGFQIGLVKYVHMDDWDSSWPTIPWDPPTCGPWSTQALVFVPLPSEGWESWESEVIPANTDVGLAANIDAIIAINVEPTSIDFGTITPGNAISGATITVKNIGQVSVTVSSELNPTSAVFQYLYLNGKQKTGGIWNAGELGMGTIAPTLAAECTTELRVPPTYSAKGEETATLIFIAVPK